MRQTIKTIKKNSRVILFQMHAGKKQIARVYLYIIKNNLHKRPYGFLEDLFVESSMRGQGLGTALLRAAIARAKKEKCYKIIGTSRMSRSALHSFYEKNGFKTYGIEFRIDLI